MKQLDKIVISSALPLTNRLWIKNSVMYYYNGGWKSLSYVDSSKYSFKALEKQLNYLYEIYYDDLDYDNAYKYFENQKDTDAAFSGCLSSVVKNGNWFGTNYDWEYDQHVDFVVHVPRIGNRYASIGIASNVEGMTREALEGDINGNIFKTLPFKIVDGINEKGVFMSIGLVPLDKGNNDTEATVSQKVKICSSMLIRYVLDYFSTSDEAVDYMKRYMSIYLPTKMRERNYECHFFVGDRTNSYIVEFINNTVVATKVLGTLQNNEQSNSLFGKPYMTNFYLKDVTFDSNGKVIINRDNSGINQSGVTLNGCGLERYNYIVDNYATMTSKTSFSTAMYNLRYTKAYDVYGTDFNLYTEYVNKNGLNCTSSTDRFQSTLQEWRTKYLNRSRSKDDENYGTLLTVHGSIYDIKYCKVFVRSLEVSTEYEFEIGITYTAEEIDLKFSDLGTVYKLKGSCLFAAIPVSGMEAGDVWDIKDDFIIDSRFAEYETYGPKKYNAGTNIVYTTDGKWDCLSSGANVTITSTGLAVTHVDDNWDISVSTDKALVSPVISPVWTVDTYTYTLASIVLEVGQTANLSATWKWTHNSNNKDPQTTSGDWGTTLPATGVSSSTVTVTGITKDSSKKSWAQTIYAPKVGLEVSGTKVVPVSGNDSKSASVSVSFTNRRYWGYATTIPTTSEEIRALSSEQSTNKTKSWSGVSPSGSQYTIFAYPKAYGLLSKIIQDGATPVLDAFHVSTVSVTNAYGLAQDYYVYVSANLGAFSNATLAFS